MLSVELYITPVIWRIMHYTCYQEDYTLDMLSLGLQVTTVIYRIIHYT